MKKMQIVQKTLLVLMAAVLLLLNSGVGFAQTGKVVLEQGSAKIFQTSDGWEMYHGNERVAHGDGMLNIGNMPPGFRALFESFSQIPESKRLITKVSKATSITYGPLIRTKWNQGTPWNNLCPTIEYTDKDGVKQAKPGITGCVTVSSAQVLYYYKYCKPFSIEHQGHTCAYKISATSNEYTITNVQELKKSDGGSYYTYDCYMPEYTPDFDKIGYDDYELAKLMAAVALTQKASFGTGSVDEGTPTYTLDQRNAFQNTFGYEVEFYSSVASLSQSSYIENAIKQGQVLIVDGPGHSYLFDGWNGNEVHIDWGWGGYSNGWYSQEAYNQTKYAGNMNIAIVRPKDFVCMQQTPKYLHIKGNGVDKKLNMTLQTGIDYKAEVELEAGTYEFYFEYADGKVAAPYTSKVITLDYNNSKYNSYGGFIASPAQFTIPNRYNVEFWHCAAMNEVRINISDLVVSISGKVFNGTTPVESAYVMSSPEKPAEHITESTYVTQHGGRVVSNTWLTNQLDIQEGKYITKIAASFWVCGKPETLTVALLDENNQVLWEKNLTAADIKDGWTEMEIGRVFPFDKSLKYFIGLMDKNYSSQSRNYFCAYQNSRYDVAYRVITTDVAVTRTDKDGNYSIEICNPFNGKLYAFAEGMEFEPLSFTNVSSNLTGQNIKNGSASKYNTIMGYVLDENSNGLPFADVSLSADRTANTTVKADAKGYYTIDVDKNYTGKIYAFADGYQFEPISVSNVTGVQTGKDFKGVSTVVTISGKVVAEDGLGIAGAEVSLTADRQSGQTVKTAGNGNYSIKVDKNFSGKLYAFVDGSDFSPINLSNVSKDLVNQNFKELSKYVTVSGCVKDQSGRGLAGVSISESSTKSAPTIESQNDNSKYCTTLNDRTYHLPLTNSFISQIDLKFYTVGNPSNFTLSLLNNKGVLLWQKVLKSSELNFWTEWTPIEVGIAVNVSDGLVINLKSERENTDPDLLYFMYDGSMIVYRLHTSNDTKAITDAEGNYSTVVRRHSNLTLYALSDNVQFDPLTLKDVATDLSGQDFKIKGTDQPKTYTVSGKVTDVNFKALAGAEVSLSEYRESGKTVKTDSYGKYTITVDRDFSGKIYAFASNYVFEPITLSKISSNLTGKNFTGASKYLTISGKVTDANSKAISGAEVSLTASKQSDKTVKTGSDGNYTITVERYFAGKLYAFADGYTFTPLTLTSVTTNQTGKNFKGVKIVPDNVKIVGTVYDQNNNTAVSADVYATVDGVKKSVKTDSKGAYVFEVAKGTASLTLNVSYSNLTYKALTFSNITTDLSGKNFKPEITTYTITGKVTDANSNAISGAEVSLTADKQADKTVKTDNYGNYKITVESGFTGKLYAFADGYEFAAMSISSVTSNLTGKNFKGTELVVFYTISGKVTDAASKAISGAYVSLSADRPAGQTVQTDRNGNFTISVEKNFYGNLYVFADGYTFDPLTISKITADVTGKIIKGTKLQIWYTVSGKVYDDNFLTITEAEVSLSADKATDKTVKVDANGSYTISVEENFSGKLYAFAKNYEFTPLTLNKVTANLTNQDFRGVEICDSKTVTISGKVMDVNYNTIAGAEVYTAVDGKTVTTLDKEKTSEGTIYMVDTRDFSRNYTANTFTPSENKIGRIEFKVQYWGTPGKLTLAVLDKSRKAVWQKDMSSDEISNDAWTAVDLDLAVTAGQQYYVALKENSTSNRCYAYYDTDADDGMVYKIYSLTGGQTRKSVQTNAAGEYSYEVDNGADVTLYVEYGNKMFNSLTLTQVRKNMLYQDIYEVGAADPNKKLATVSGKVLDVRGRGLANAWVTESYKAPEATSKFESAETCYSFKTKDMEFTAGGKYLTRVDFMISKQGNTGDLKVAILDGTKNELWSKTLTNDETTAWQWKEIALDQSIELTPGNSYFIRLQTSGSGTYYYVMDNANWDMVHRIWTSDSPCVKTNDQGEYQLKAEKGTSATLHAYCDDLRFNVVTYEKLSSNLTGQDFRVFASTALPGEKTVQTPVSEIAKTSNIKVWSYESTIYIEGANVGTVFSITDNMGRIVINKSEVKSTREEIVPGASGVMIVRIGQQSFKVFVE